MFLCDTHASRFSTFSSPLFFVCRVRVLGMNWALAGGSECSNKQEAVLNPAAEGGWGRGQKLTQCALTERFSGNTSASEKWWLEMHLSSRVGYFKDEELIVADLRISLQVGHSFIIRARLVKYSEQACECIGLAKLGFRPSFFFLYAGTLFAWLFWRTWRWAEELGEAKLSLALFFFFHENVERSERSPFHPNMEWKTVSQLEHIPGMGINSFLLISIHGSSFFPWISDYEVQTPLSPGPCRRRLEWLLICEWRWRALVI